MILLQAAPKQPTHCSGRVGRNRGPVWFSFEDAGDDVRARVAVEGEASSQHFEQHAAERPDVGAAIDGRTASLLRTHVRRGADHGSL